KTGGVQADALPAAPDDKYLATRAQGQWRHDRSPGIRKVVAGGGHAQRVEAVWERDKVEVREGDAKRVGDHSAPLATRRPEPESGQRLAGAQSRQRGTLGRQAEPAFVAGAAGDGPGHDHDVADGKVG